jgi:acid phosphatase (class A)
MSAVETGRLATTVTMTVVRATPAYRKEMLAARAELAALRKTTAAPAACEAEKALISQSIYTPAP